MSTLVSIALANAVCAALLALVALLVGRFCRRPAVLHSLWLLVLLKLVTPPFWPVTIASLPNEATVPRETASMNQVVFTLPAPDSSQALAWMNASQGQPLTARITEEANAVNVKSEMDVIRPAKVVPANIEDARRQPESAIPSAFVATPAPDAEPRGLESCVPMLGILWLVGVVVWFVRAGVYIGRFQHLLRHARPAGADVQGQAHLLARQMGLNHCPQVWLLPGPLPPLVWAALGRVRIFFPAKLLERLDATERASLLVHELAHVRRRDHWLRWLELIAAALYWWYPLVWLARRRLHIHEEECCDAWVVGEVPPRTYAAAILNTLDFLAEDRVPLPVMASGLAGVEMLKRRLHMIMDGGVPKCLSSSSKLVVLLACLLLLPLRPNLAQAEKKPGEVPESTAAKPEAGTLIDSAEEPTVFNPQPKNLLGNNDIWSVAISPDGKRLVSGGGSWDRSGDVRVWDLATQRQLLMFREPLGVPSVAISPNDKLLASANWAGEGRIRDLASGKEIARLKLDGVAQVAFSPDSKLLATASQGNTVALWDAISGRQQAILKGDVFRFHCIAFAPDGKTLAAGGGSWTANGMNQVNLWDVATRKQVGKLQGHTGAVLAVAYTRDGRTMATGGVDNTVRLWDAATGKQRASFQAGRNWVEGLAFSPDGKMLVADTAGNMARMWDVATGAEVGRFEGHKGKVKSLAFSPDGKHLASGSSDRTVKWWDVDTQKELATFRRAEDGSIEVAPLMIAGSPDGKTLALALEDNTVQLCDAVTGDFRLTLKGHEDAVTCLAFSPDGKTLASGSPDRSVRLWDPASGETRRILKGHTNWIYAVAFSPDGKTLASAGYDKTIRLWDPASGETRRILKGHKASVRALAFSPDGKMLASGSGDRTIKLWPLTSEEDPITLKGHEGSVRAVAFSPDGKTLASGGEDQTVKLWDVAKKSERATLKGHNAEVMTLAFSPGGKSLASGGADNAIFLWDSATGTRRGQLRGHSDAVTTVLFAPGARLLLSASLDRTIKIWQAQAMPVRLLRGHTGPVRGLVISRDGGRLLSGSGWPQGDKTMRLWELKTGKKLRVFRAETPPEGREPSELPNEVYAIAASADGKQAVSAGTGGVVILWDMETGKELRRFHGHAGAIYALDFAPDGRHVLSGGHDKTVRLWDVDSGREVRKYEGHTHWVRSVRFSRDGRRFLSGGWDGVPRLWDVDGKKPPRQFQTKAANDCVVWTPDNRQAVFASGPTIQLWDVESGAMLRSMQGHPGGVTSVDVSPDGRKILSCGYDGTVRYWDVAFGEQKKLFRQTGYVWAVKFSPDGQQAVSAGGGRFADGKHVPGDDFDIRVWSLAEEGPARTMTKSNSN